MPSERIFLAALLPVLLLATSALTAQARSLNLNDLFIPPVLVNEDSLQLPKILDGSFVASDSDGWKFTARLVITKKDFFIATCSAVLIHRRVLLTAAHCLKDIAGIKVVLGDPEESEISNSGAPIRGASYSTNQLVYKSHPDYRPVKKPNPQNQSPSNEYSVAQADFRNMQSIDYDDRFLDEAGNIIFLKENYEAHKQDYLKRFEQEQHTLLSFHESLSAPRRSDIGVIVLDDEVPEPFNPLTIWDSQPELALKFGDELFTFGYGYHSLNTAQRDLALRFTNLNFVGLIGDPGKALQIVGFSMDGGGPIQGDSGGPVAVKINDQFYLVGINSAGGHDGHSMATVPQTFLPWIKQTIQTLSHNQL